MTLVELENARWDAMVKLAGAVQAYQAVMDAGHADSTHELAGWLDKLEADYVALYRRQRAVLDSGHDMEEPAAA